MSTWKATPSNERGRLARNKLKIAEGDAAILSPAQQVEVTSLKIESDQERDFDPYNSTGQFCVVKEKKTD